MKHFQREVPLQFKHKKGEKGVDSFHHREIQKTLSPSSPEMFNVTNAFLHSSPFIEKHQVSLEVMMINLHTRPFSNDQFATPFINLFAEYTSIHIHVYPTISCLECICISIQYECKI